MNKKLIAATAFSLACLLGGTASLYAQEAVGPRLTPKLKGLLVKEMQAVLGAQQTILKAIVQGEHETVAQQARQIHNSFILKQSLTPEDRKDLQAAVPEGFILTDRAFHEAAAALADAALMGDSEAQLDQFAKMNNFCLTCHSRYAVDRFPGLQP